MKRNAREAAGLDVKAANDDAYAYESWCRAVDYQVRMCTGVAPEDYPPATTDEKAPGRMRRWFKQGIEASEVAACIVHEIVRHK